MTLAGLAAKNILRNKFRTVLTILGVAIACLTFVFLRTVLSSWKNGAEYSAKDRVVTRNKTTIVVPIPIRYADEIRAMPHVKSSMHGTWFGGTEPNHENDFFAVFAVEHATLFPTFGDEDFALTADEKKAWVEDRRGLLVGDVIAKKFGWKTGDTVVLESGLFPPKPGETWTFKVSGVFAPKSKSVDRSAMYMHYDYLNDSLDPRRQNLVNFVTTLADSPGSAADLSRTIDQNFDGKEQQTFTQDERSFRTGFLASISAVLRGLDVITLAIMVIMMLVLGNTIAMGVRERTNEYGVLRALGFLPRHVALFILGEAMLTGVLGGIFGVAIALPLIQFGMRPFVEANLGNLFPNFAVEPLVAAAALGLAALLSVVAAAIPAVRASRLQIVDALRRVA